MNRSLEKKVGVKSPGRWFELGYDQTWTRNTKITKMEDFKGLKIRHSGGSIPEGRLNAFGASAVFIAWPDVPMALVQGTVDGCCSTTKSVEGAKLYEAGIKYGLLSRNFNGYYVPLVNLKFWNSLPPDLQKIFTEVWNEVVPRAAGDRPEGAGRKPGRSWKAKGWNSMSRATKSWPSGVSTSCQFRTK